MNRNRSRAFATLSFTLMVVLSAVGLGLAQDAKSPYPSMAPPDQYLMANHNAEITLARSAAPRAISRDATILVLGRHGYKKAVEGKNGFVCMVERGWMGAFDYTEFWNPRIRGPVCLNPPAARSILPIAYERTRLVLAGRSKAEIIDTISAAFDQKKLPQLEPGAMSYMMSKAAYLTDQGDHNGAHLMFYVSLTDGAVWGAGLPNSPVASAPYWFSSEISNPQFKALPPIRIFIVSVGTWSDGTAAPVM